MKVSIITPTYNRESYHDKIYQYVVNQKYENIEWLILDDSETPSIFLSQILDQRIKYYHSTEKTSIGNKRNWLIDNSSGDLIVHFDDDDYYSPDYISSVVEKFTNENVDFTNLRGWFLYDKRNNFFGYWDLNEKDSRHFKITGKEESIIESAINGFENNHLGWGFGFAYRKTVWEQIKFEDINWKEDEIFSVEAHKHFKCSYIKDTSGICLHVIHNHNTSVSFSQHKLPLFLLDKLFPDFKDKSQRYNMKTAVYAIALNEIKHVDQFMESCKGADMVIVCDTGSTDGTVERLKELGAIVHCINQKPWRFDIARNTALSLVPLDVDICLAIDLDEYLQPGWVNAIKDIWKKTNGKVNRIRYDYIWSWNADGTPGGRFYASKIHSRQGYCWHYPCHEVIQWCGNEQELIMTADTLQLQHHADNTKSRGQYLNLLKLGIVEEPYSDRARYYYARELMFNSQWQEAIDHFKIHIDLPSSKWKEERAASYRHIAYCYRQMSRFSEAYDAAIKGMLEWNETREPWMEIARAAYALKDWATCYWAAIKTLAIPTVSTTYVSDPQSWGYEPHDLAALSAFYLGLYNEALIQGQIALEKSPNIQRLHDNMKFYSSKVDSQES